MSLKLSNIRRPVEEPESELPAAIARRLKIQPHNIARWRILRKSLDARSRKDLSFVYSVIVDLHEDDAHAIRGNPSEVDRFVAQTFDDPEPGDKPLSGRPVVIGSGPAGLLAGYYLAAKGYRPLILERGQPVKPRVQA